jgi:hypothetical protein
MNRLRIDTTAPQLSVDDRFIAPLDHKQFVAAASGLVRLEKNLPPGSCTIGYQIESVELLGKNFEVKIRFDGEAMTAVSLIWLEGESERKGWDATEADVVADKRSLERMLKKVIGRPVDFSDDYVSRYTFSCGEIHAVAVRKAQYAKIVPKFISSNLIVKMVIGEHSVFIP